MAARGREGKSVAVRYLGPSSAYVLGDHAFRRGGRPVPVMLGSWARTALQAAAAAGHRFEIAAAEIEERHDKTEGAER